MQTITIMYWQRPIEGIKYTHLQEMPYSTRKLNQIVNYVLGKNCYVMIYPQKDGNRIIWINNKTFGQS